MAACPVCQTEIEITSQHFGTLYTCPSCSAVFFVDWNGQPEGAPAQEETLEPVTGEGFSPFEEPTRDFSDSEETPTYESAGIEQTPETTSSENYDFSQPLGQVEPVSPDPTEPFADVTDFANSDLAKAAFNYSVMISGIDSSAVYAEVKEALSDSKFGWNAIQVMSQIKDGVLTIKSINAVKASILVQRVKYLPVKVSWRQDVLSSHV
jgi:hypothetical protein